MPDLNSLEILAQVVSRNKVKHIQIVGSPQSRGSKFDRLYQGLLSGSFQSEEAAARALYGTGPQNPAYRQLKSRLEDRLLNTLFFIDVNQPGFTDIQKAYYTLYKNLAFVKILFGRHKREIAIRIAEKSLKKAMQFELTFLILELARELRIHYGYSNNKNKLNYYNKIIEKNSHIYFAELEAEEYFSQLTNAFIKSKGSNLALSKLANQFSAKLQKKLQVFHSYRFSLYAYLVLLTNYEIKNDYLKMLQICQEAIAYFETKSHITSPTILYGFQMKMLPSYIRLGSYAAAETTSQNCLRLQSSGSFNWYQVLDYTMILHYHAGQPQKAYHTFLQATQHPNFKRQSTNIAEQWRIHEGFIHLLIRLGKIQPAEGVSSKKFRIRKFLNEVPLYSKDKRGANINILILQVLLLLTEGRYGEIIDRMEALQTYAYRYLRRDETYRSNCFIKMLSALPQGNFHVQAVRRKAEKYWKKLQEVPLLEARQNVELEIIPYETLWAYALELLDKRPQ